MSLVTVRTAAESRDLTTIELVREALGFSNAANDAKIGRLVHNASALVEHFTDRIFARELVTEKLGIDREGFPEFSPFRMTLSRIPILTIDAARFDGQDVDVTTIEVENSDAGFLFRTEGFGETLIESHAIERVSTRFHQPLWEIDYSAGYVLPTFPLVSEDFATTDVDISSDTITITGHGLVNGDTVEFSTDGTLPAGLVKRRPYLVRDASDDTFKVSGRPGDGVVDITDVGSGTHTVTRKRTLPHDLEGAVIDLVSSHYSKLGRDLDIASERLGDHSVSYGASGGMASGGMASRIPVSIQDQLRRWIRL